MIYATTIVGLPYWLSSDNLQMKALAVNPHPISIGIRYSTLHQPLNVQNLGIATGRPSTSIVNLYIGARIIAEVKPNAVARLLSIFLSFLRAHTKQCLLFYIHCNQLRRFDFMSYLSR